MNAQVDHVLIAVEELEGAILRWQSAGLPATHGGKHPGGTSNALVRGREHAYLELITAHERSTSGAGRRVLETSGPLSWALGVKDIEQSRAAAKAHGLRPSEIAAGSRTTPDGETLRWRICDLVETPLHPYVPFLIEWETPLPPGPPDGPTLTGVTVQAPDPEALSSVLSACGLPVAERVQGSIAHSDGSVSLTIEKGEGGVTSAEWVVHHGRRLEGRVDGLSVTTVPAASTDQ